MEKTMERESMEKCARERLEKELRELNLNPPTCISLGPVSKDDMFHWQAIIIGPADTHLEGTLFHLTIQFPIDYPFKPPTVRFQTQVCSFVIQTSGEMATFLLIYSEISGILASMQRNYYSPSPQFSLTQFWKASIQFWKTSKVSILVAAGRIIATRKEGDGTNRNGGAGQGSSFFFSFDLKAAAASLEKEQRRHGALPFDN